MDSPADFKNRTGIAVIKESKDGIAFAQPIQIRLGDFVTSWTYLMDRGPDRDTETQQLVANRFHKPTLAHTEEGRR